METIGERIDKSRRAMVREAEGWRRFFAAHAAAASRAARKVLTPSTIERSSLRRVVGALEHLREAVLRRLDALDQQLPIAGYDELTARAIVSELDALSTSQRRAVLDFESSHKKRATVLRALEAKLAA